MGLDRAYFEFQKLVFFGTPYPQIHVKLGKQDVPPKYLLVHWTFQEGAVNYIMTSHGLLQSSFFTFCTCPDLLKLFIVCIQVLFRHSFSALAPTDKAHGFLRTRMVPGNVSVPMANGPSVIISVGIHISVLSTFVVHFDGFGEQSKQVLKH